MMMYVQPLMVKVTLMLYNLARLAFSWKREKPR